MKRHFHVPFTEKQNSSHDPRICDMPEERRIQFKCYNVQGSTIPADKLKFKPVASAGSRQAESSQPISQTQIEAENILCNKSETQEELYAAVLCLMTLREDQQKRLLHLLCNHPFLLYKDIVQNYADLQQHHNSKRARKEFVNYGVVMCKFPTRFERAFCKVSDSGKMYKLFQMVTQWIDEDESTRIIVVSSSVKVLDMLDQLFTILHFSLFQINSNTARLSIEQILQQEKDVIGRKLILLHAKANYLHCPEFFEMAKLIFYDFDAYNDIHLLSRWGANEVQLQSVCRLITKDSVEDEQII